MAGRCESVRYGDPCREPSAGRTTMGCVHEHIGTADICADCRSVMLRCMTEGAFSCDPCSGIDGHRCPLRELSFTAAAHA